MNRKDADNLAAELRALPNQPTVGVVAADVRDAAQIETLMKQVKETCGGLDILVNNAGIIRDRTLKKMTLDEWHAVIQTNLDGVFHCCKYGTEILRDGGRIVNIASVAGLVGFHGQANYAAAKAGVIGMTRVLAKELARRQITVNAIAPGRHPDADARRDQAGGDGRIPQADPARPARHARRHRQRRPLPGQRGERLHHRPGVAGDGRMGLDPDPEVMKQLTIVVKPFRPRRCCA